MAERDPHTVRDAVFIWFDFGGVLSPSLQDLFDGYERKTGLDRASLESAMQAVAREMGVPTLAPVELAMISEREWGTRMREFLTGARPDLDLSRARLEEFGEQWFAEVLPNEGMLETLREYRERGFRVGILSNNVIEWEPHWHRIVADALPIDALVDSCRVGSRKPQPEFFAIAEKVAGVVSHQCVLIDDLSENCAAARARGWHAIQFGDNVQVRRELADMVNDVGILRGDPA